MSSSGISFGQGHPTLDDHDSVEWKVGESHDVEFFPGKWFHVLLATSDDPNIESLLKHLEDGAPIAIDLEWNDEICLFQFCSSKGVLVIRHPKGPGHPAIHSFLTRNLFYGKGMSNDRKQLYQKFHSEFPEMEDIEATRLRPYGFSDNFIEMTREFAGEPTAEFKDLRITTSDWEAETLSSRQVLYAAFDVVALFVAYPNFKPVSQTKVKRKKETKKAQKAPSVRKMSAPKGPRMNEKVTLRDCPALKSYSYLCENYHGTKSRIELRKCFQNLDFVSAFEFEEYKFLFVSSFKELPDTVQKEWNLRILPEIEVEEAGALDVLFLTNIPFDPTSMSQFLYCFGVDQVVTYNESFVRIEPRNAQCSYRMQTFIPHINFGEMRMNVSKFPFFLPRIRIVNLPHTTSEDDILRLLPGASNISFIRARNEFDPRKVELDLPNVEAADDAVQKLNYSDFEGQQIFVTRYTDEVQRRHMRTYELVVFSDEDHLQLRERFSVFGPLFQAIHDPRFGLGHVQFYRKKDAIQALSSTAQFNEEGSTAVVRELSLQITEKEVCEIFSRFGTIRNLVFRDMSQWHLLSVVDITYSTAQEAMDCKLAMNRKKLKEALLHVSIQKNDEVPDWKMTQMNQWVKVATFDSIQECTQFGDVIDCTEFDGEYFVMFKEVQSATNAIKEMNALPLTKFEFVHKTSVRNLEYGMVESVPEKAKQPQATAILLEPLPEYLTYDKIMELCGHCGDFELYIVPSLTYPDSSRMIIYTRSRGMTKKVFTILCCQRYNEELLKPRKLKPEEVIDPPERPTDIRTKYGTKPLCEVDPFPDDVKLEDLHVSVPPSSFEWWIEGSAKISGCRRLIVKVKDGQIRKSLAKELTSFRLKVKIVKANNIQLPL